MKHLKILFAFISCCVSYSITAQEECPVVNIAKALKAEAKVLNLSDMTDYVYCNMIEQNNLYESAGKIECGKESVLFKQTLHHGKNLSEQHTYSGEFIDNGIIENNESILYYQLSGNIMQIFDTEGNIIKSIKLPDWVNKICPMPTNKLLAYRTRNNGRTEKGLAGFCIIDLKTNKTIFTHFSLSKKEASENKLWYPLMNNKAWTYSGKTYFYENISNNIYEIVINSDNRFSLNKRFTINMSPLSVDYPQTSRMNQEDYKAGTALHLSDIKEMSKCIIFSTVLNKEQKRVALIKASNETVNILRINPDLDGVANGDAIIPFIRIDKKQQEILLQKKHRGKHETENLFAIPMYK